MTLLSVENLQKHYPIRHGLLQRQVGAVRAVDDVSFDLERGETLSLVGESGCGKTTVSRCVIRALRPTAGHVRFRSETGEIDLAALSKSALKPVRRQMQMVFQDPNSSLNPRMTVGDIIAEPLLINRAGDAAARQRRVRELLELVGLPRAAINRFPHAFSGGQRQRIGIARALALNPALVIADEPVSALDVSVQAQVINLMLDLQRELGLSYLFVSHDLGVVKHMSDRVAVMYLGRVVEIAPTRELFARPKHPYTSALLSAVPKARPGQASTRQVLGGEVGDPSNPPPGCAFHPRCPFAVDRCRQEVPAEREMAAGHRVRCHRAEELTLAGVDGQKDLVPA